MKRILLTFLLAIILYPMCIHAQYRENGKTKLPNATTDVVRKELMIPNAFSPNNDGQNDVFVINNITDEKLIDFKIFNRWGTIVFRTSNPGEGWDGMYKGEVQPVGTYGYVIRIGYPDGYIETYKGTLTLIK